MYGKAQEYGITEVILFIYISAIWGQHPVLLISHIPAPLRQLLSNHCGKSEGVAASAGSKALCSLLGALIRIWKPSFAFGSPKSLTAVTFLFIDTAGDIPFHSTHLACPCHTAVTHLPLPPDSRKERGEITPLPLSHFNVVAQFLAYNRTITNLGPVSECLE